MGKNSNTIDLNYSDIPRPVKFILLGVGFVGIFVLRVLRPVYHIRLGIFVNERLGDLATRVEYYLREGISKKLSTREVHIFISGKPANAQLFKMIKRKITVFMVHRYFLWVIRKLRSLYNDSPLWVDFDNYTNIYTIFDTISPQLSFTPEEEAQGKQLLESLGINSNSQFVCLHVRDKAYLDKIHPYRNREQWAYHDYRDADIDNYVATVEYLASKGIYIIRMGFMVEKEFEINSPYVIDYANKHRSDFGDIYLSAKCKFFIGSEGGLITIPWIFNVPVAYSNRVPVTAIAGYHHSNIFLPKKLWLKSEERFLTFHEIHMKGADKWFQSQPYEQAGIDVIENTSEEICGLVREMNSRLDGTPFLTEEDEQLQQRYWEIWPKDLDSYRSKSSLSVEYAPSKCNGSLPRISTEFLRLNNQLLDKTTKKIQV